MSFTAEEIGRFDAILSGLFHQKLIETILIEIGVLIFLIILFVMSRNKKMAYSKWSVITSMTEDNQTRYRNGKKLDRRERDAQRNAQKARVRQENEAWIAIIGVLALCLGVALGITSAVRLERMQRDMDENTYVVYEGEFECSYVGSYIEVTLTFPDENGNTVSVKGDEHDLDYPEVGKHRGRVVYAKNCGYVIEVEWEATEP